MSREPSFVPQQPADNADLSGPSAAVRPDQSAGLLQGATLAGQVFGWLTATLNPSAQVERFVRLLTPTASQQPGAARPTSPDPVISLLLSTTLQHRELLTECLYSVYVQDCPSGKYEIVLASTSASTPDAQGEPAGGEAKAFLELKAFLKNFPADLQNNLRLLDLASPGPGRADTRNRLMEAAQGQYMVFLDEDDLLLDGALPILLDGIARYGQTDAILHSFAVRRELAVSDWASVAARTTDPARLQAEFSDSPGPGPGSTFPYAAANIRLEWARPFDPLRQQYQNEGPLCRYALPRRLVSDTTLRYEGAFEQYAEWDFLLRATRLCQVVTLPHFLTARNVRTEVLDPAEAEREQTLYEKCLAANAARPLLLEGRAGMALADLYRAQEAEANRKIEAEALHQAQREELNARIAAQGSELARLRRQAVEESETLDYRLEALRRESQAHKQQALEAGAYALRLEQTLAAIHQSLGWKLTAPLRRLLARRGKAT